ncbi:MAG TPA: spermidine/putrescine ABC transporter substrate-binding protein [Alphaproteobacteria bacterium]|nr:spermidine/putrescine ABC transporter substrate-binding protein [Alphaproteobacteria bacterium]
MRKTLIRPRSRRSLLKGLGVAGVAISILPRRGVAAEEKKLNVYNWDTYIGETTLDTFTEKTGIEVQYDLFANNEELFAKLKAGNPGYDIIVPTDYTLADMISVGMVQPLDHSKIPNLKNIDPDPVFTDPSFNPGLKYGVPYMWGTVGLGYRPSKTGEIDSLAAIFDSDKFSGRIALLDDQRSVLGYALKFLGYSLNSTNPDEITQARDLLIKQKKHIKTLAGDNGQDLLLAGEVDITMEYNGDIVQIQAEDEDIAYVVPKEGGIVWFDNMAIASGAPHPENAHAFINHVYDAEVNAELTNTIQYATPNAAGRALINPDDLNNPAIYPPADVIAKSESFSPLGDGLRLYDEAWTAFKAA